MNPAATDSGLKCYDYISAHVNARMTIMDNFENIIKRLEDIYMLGGMKGLFFENPCNFVMVVV